MFEAVVSLHELALAYAIIVKGLMNRLDVLSLSITMILVKSDAISLLSACENENRTRAHYTSLL